jgi:hypothetical protein
MRNLKKILALVLALVMTMSVMSIASAAKAGTGYSDDASITNSNFDEAIQVLTGLGIYRGDDEGAFRPNSTITRAEAAALVYRIISTDVNDKQTSIYADYNKFDDVKSTSWYAGYVNFCANGQYIVGNGDGTFNPSGDITGYQLLAIILRALGYGQNAEYQGTGWEIRTATDAKKLGITKNINESTLGQAQTRAAVAEMLFQGLTCTQTVDYTALLGYTSNASELTGKTTHGTLGYEKFGLRGYYAASEKDEDATGLINGYALSELTSNAPAIADNRLESADDIADFAGVTVDEDGAIDETQSQIVVTSLYGEPVSFWYATSIVTKANPAGEIEVRYNPVASYSTKTNEDTMFAALGASGISTTVAEENYNEDGENVEEITLYKSLEAKKTALGDRTVTLDPYGGKGTSTELFVVDGSEFVVVKNTYVDKVSQAYSAKYLLPLELANSTLDLAEFAQQDADMVSGLARRSVVIFNVYNGTADISTVHTATSKTVTLTNSYVTDLGENKDDCEASYFVVGSTKYEYDCNTLDTELANAESYELLDRTKLLAADPTEDTQALYFDDYGYVIYSEAVTSSNTEGYMIVTKTEYGGYDKDNGYYLDITGYDIDGKSVTVQGGFDTFVYAIKSEAQDYQASIGIYKYTKDLDTGFMNLEEAGETSSAESVYAGDPDAVDSTAISDSTTVFVVANYSAKGAITGYDVYTGIKNIKDLKDAELDDKSTVIYDSETTDWAVTYVDDDTVPGGADERVDLVLVLGAKQSADVKLSSSIAVVPETFYLLDEVPEMQFAEYNQYAVIKDGKRTTINVSVDAEGTATEYDTIFEGVGFYKITAWAGDYVYGVEKIDESEITYQGVDVLGIDSGNGSIWDYASCHEGDGQENGGFVVLADNCKLYDITGGKVVEIEAEDLIIDEDLPNGAENALGYSGVNGIVGDWDAYGFATVIYVVSAD